MSHLFGIICVLHFLTTCAFAGSIIEFNITQETKRNEEQDKKIQCNEQSIYNLEVDDECQVQVVIRHHGTHIADARCTRYILEQSTQIQIQKQLNLKKANWTEGENGNTFYDTINITSTMEGMWDCSILIDDQRFTKDRVPFNDRNNARVVCKLNLHVRPNITDNVYTKYQYWIIGGACVGALILAIMITQAVIIIKFRARVNTTRYMRPLSIIRNRIDRTRQTTKQRVSVDSDDYEAIQNIYVGHASSPSPDIRYRPPMPLPEEELPFNNNGALRRRTPSPPPINSLPRRHHLRHSEAEELRPPPPPSLPIEMKPAKISDPMINELGNRLRTRRDFDTEEPFPQVPKRNFKSPNPPPVPPKSQSRTNITTCDFESRLPPQMHLSSSQHFRSMEILQPTHWPNKSKTPNTRRRQCMPDHNRMEENRFQNMQPETFLMQHNGSLPMPKKKNHRHPNNSLPSQHPHGKFSLPRPHVPQTLEMQNSRFAHHMRSTPDITAPLTPRMPLGQQPRVKFSGSPTVKIPPPVQRKACLQATPSMCNIQYPPPWSTNAAADYQAGSDEEWNYEDLAPVQKYLHR